MRRLFCFQIIGLRESITKLVIGRLKVIVVALAIGTVFMACAQTEECCECTVQGASMSDNDKAAFEAAFIEQHNPSLYNINCVDKFRLIKDGN
jgi:hypothetical protein